MSAVAEASSLLDEISAPREARETYKAVLHRVAAFVNRVGLASGLIEQPISPYRLDDIWRREARYVRSDEMDSLRAARDQKLLGEVRNARSSALDRIAALEAALRIQDEEFHRETLAALRDTTRGPDRPMGSR